MHYILGCGPVSRFNEFIPTKFSNIRESLGRSINGFDFIVSKQELYRLAEIIALTEAVQRFMGHLIGPKPDVVFKSIDVTDLSASQSVWNDRSGT